MDKSHFFIYDASAGSGKTYTIAKEYLSILLLQDGSFAFQNILAITFTNKAAAEMKQRIVNALIYFSGLDQSGNFESLLNDVAKQTKLSKEEIQRKSLSVLKFLIPNYASFEVSTIDRFNHRIIRTFARDLSISQNFEVDLDTTPYIQEAIERLIEEVGEDENLTAWLIEFVKYKLNNNRSGLIERDLKSYADLILNENNYEAIEQIQKLELNNLKTIQSKVKKHQESILKELQEIAEDFFELMEQHDIDTKCFPRQTIPNYFNKILKEEIEAKFESKWHGNIENASFYTKAYSEKYEDILESLRPQIVSLFLDSKAKSFQYHLAELVIKNFVPLAMISEIQHRLKDIKEERGVLFVNDFNRILSKHIQHQPVPFVYERLGEKFRHYFIDEFQDTSKLQWKNLKPLVENAIIGQHEDGSYGSLFLVGDVKQSIYEWRGGDPQQFLDLAQGFVQPFNVKSERKVLEDNWRSVKEVVNFNNDFFEFSADNFSNPKHQELYKHAKQYHKKENQGYVDIQFFPEIKDKKEKQDHRISVLQNIIVDLQKAGYVLEDICILVRKNDQGAAIAEAFNSLETPIPVVSQESLLIASDTKVGLVIKFLQFLHYFHEETYMDFTLEWLNYQNDIQDKTSLLLELKNANFYQAIESLASIGIDFNYQLYRSLSLYDKAEYAIRVLGFAENANAYLQFLLDEFYEYSASKSLNMYGFLSYWEEVKSHKSISVTKSSGAVNIMTIHKSKGLEFPVVIYAHANFTLADLSNTSDWIPLDEEQFGIPYFYNKIIKSLENFNPDTLEVYNQNKSNQELSNMNNAYVAMTRAEEQLYILCEPINNSACKFEDLLINFLKSKALYEDSVSHYYFGIKPQKDKVSHETQETYAAFHSFPTQAFYSTLSAEDTLTTQSKAQIYGQEVHDVLEQIKYSKSISQINTTKEIKDKLNEIVSHKELEHYYQDDWTVYNERDLTFEGQILRPDRVCIKGKEVVIIDYKTGVEKEIHEQQLKSYKTAIEAMGFSIKSAFLVYIRKNIYVKSV